MSRRVNQILLAGCLLIGFLQAPAVLRSLQEGWNGAYAIEPSLEGESRQVASLLPIQADATAQSEAELLERVKEIEPPVLRAGF